MNKIKKLYAILLLLVSCYLFSSQNSEQGNIEDENSYLTFIDSRNRVVVLNKEPLRIVSLAPSITETIFALDAGYKLIGRTEYCDFPEEALSIPTIGTLYEPNIEKIVELNPDLILASTHFKKEVLVKLEELSMKVIVIDENDKIDGIYNNITKIGQILNKNDRAVVVNNSIKKRIINIENKVKNLDRPSVYYVISYGEYGDYTAGGDTFISELIEVAGGNNIAKESKGWSYSLEKIIEKNPDMLICSKYFNIKEGLVNSTGYKDLPSVISGNVFTIDNNLLDRQGPRIADALEELVKIIHKEQL